MSGLRKSGGLFKAVTKANLQASGAKGLPSLLCVPSRDISGRVNRDPEYTNRKAPFPYQEKQFSYFKSILDRTSHRLMENSKLEVVDGAHGIGKSKFAQELAEELDMHYIGDVSHDNYYVNKYGQDLRNYREVLTDKLQPMDERDWVKNPLGGPDGCSDRFLQRNYMMKYFNHMTAIRHILNTGQGVVMEKSPFSDFTIWDAAYNQGWVAPESMKFQKRSMEYSLHWLLRPNLIIYLDAPVEVVQKKVAALGNECDKNSPIWKSKDYLNDIYRAMKRQYLREAQDHSEVLVYDWSEPGDLDVVVEDIEKLNFDHISLYDRDQGDWRFGDEVNATDARIKFTTLRWLNALMQNIVRPCVFEAEHFLVHAEDHLALENFAYYVKGQRFAPGFNPEMGDAMPFFRKDDWKEMQGDMHFHCAPFALPGAKGWWDKTETISREN